MLATVAWKSRPIAGSAMPTTVASSAAMPDPSTVAASTQRPLLLLYRRSGVTSGAVLSRPASRCPTPASFPSSRGRSFLTPSLLSPKNAGASVNGTLVDHGSGDGPAPLAQVVPD